MTDKAKPSLTKKRRIKIGILSLGCPRNLVDSESILARLRLKKYSVADIGKADVAVINTCSFIEDAKKESIDAILDLIQLKEEGRLKKIIVYGCLVQRYAGQLRKDFPQVDAFVGRVSLSKNPERFPLTARHYAYLKVCEGCVNNCSYCIIPKIKGRFTSLDIDSVIKKVDAFNKSKISELNIIGQDITGFGQDLYGRPALEGLLKKIVGHARDIGWIRLLYLYPKRITEGLLYLINASPRICKYIDLPIQHINSRILKLMNRDTAKKDIFELIEKVRKKIPGVYLRTSIIVGFPSETDSEFRELLKFMQEVKFERLGAFIYSREEGTAAYGFKGQLPLKVKQERFNAVMSLQQHISRQVNNCLLGKTLDVLIDERENDYYLGRTQYDAPEVDGMVYVKSKKKLRTGEFVKVKISDTLEYDLVGDAKE